MQKCINDKWAKSVKAKSCGRKTGATLIGAKQIDKNEEELIIQLQKQGFKSIDIAKKLHRHPTSICHILRKNGIHNINNIKLKREEIDQIKGLYLSGMTIQEIHKKLDCLNVSEGAINYVLRKENVTRPNGKQATIDHNYFETIDTEEKAYFLGFLAADGCVRIEKKSQNGYSYCIRLELKVEDKYIIEKLRDELKSDLTVKEYIGQSGFKNKKYNKLKRNAYISFYSKKIFNDLAKLGIHPGKTFNLSKLPCLNPTMMKHYIRGFFDGDGTVYINKSYAEPRTIFGFYGTNSFLNSLQDYLIDINILNKKRKIFKKKVEKVSFVTYSTINDINNFYHYIYDSATIYLTRKKRKFDLYR
jgi:hypothetical protein